MYDIFAIGKVYGLIYIYSNFARASVLGKGAILTNQP